MPSTEVQSLEDQHREMELFCHQEGYDEIVLQHEYDHLDGILFYDRIDKENPIQEIENSILI